MIKHNESPEAEYTKKKSPAYRSVLPAFHVPAVFWLVSRGEVHMLNRPPFNDIVYIPKHCLT